jgi:hypothetical protein
MKIMSFGIISKILFAIFGFLLTINCLISQTITIEKYDYTLSTTGKSREEALKKATSEALSNCLQENIGIDVFGITQSMQYMDNEKFRERFSDFTLLISKGYIKRYEILDTMQSCQKFPVLETRIALNVTLAIPDMDNSLDIYADVNKTVFKANEKAEITYSVEKSSFVYFFALTSTDSILVLYEPEEKTQARGVLKFPDPATPYSLVMSKEIEDDFEFGCFIVLATKKKLNFPEIKMHNTGERFEKLKVYSIEQFHQLISSLDGENSIKYLPYSIE